MKYTYALVIAICLLSSTSWSKPNNNPLMKFCRLSGGIFTVVETADDQLGLCAFGDAYVGSLDVLLFKSEQKMTDALTEYANGNNTCTGEVIDAQILKGAPIKLCVNSDESIIDVLTLKKGYSHPSNQQLNNFLGL